MRSDRDIRELIFEIIRDKGDISIAGMVRELEERGVQHHRLLVSGYLSALADVGLLEERWRPPTRLYSMKDSPRTSLCSVVGKAARKVSTTEPRAVEVAVATLERMLDRPIFMSELAEAGFTRTSNLRQLGKRERTEALERMEEGGVRVREGEALFRAREHREEEVHRLLAEALIEAMDAQRERIREAHQVSLTLDEF